MTEAEQTLTIREGKEYKTVIAVVDDLPTAWAAVFTYAADIVEPSIVIQPIWHTANGEESAVTRFEVTVSSVSKLASG